MNFFKGLGKTISRAIRDMEFFGRLIILELIMAKHLGIEHVYKFDIDECLEFMLK